MKLRAGYLAVAMKLQEAADSALSAGDIRTRLSDALHDAVRGTGNWAYYIDHFGDGESGDVIYSHNSDTCRAPYSITADGKATKCVIDFEQKVDVVPRTIYEQEADEPDHYAAMEESLKAENLYTELPAYERFISKKERDGAGGDDFAGKGRSYPILKPEDVPAAAHALGRAGSGNLGTNAIKNRIISIAKRKGWTSKLPKAWQGEQTTESEKPASVGTDGRLSLVEAAAACEAITITESGAKSDFEIKLIAPGRGSSAFYPAEVLKRDGPKVFKAGTHVYLNHPTRAEEAERPEGDVKNLAGVLTSPAVYHESHAKGAGLYSRMKVFADHATQISEKAAHVGMSIRAAGLAESGVQREGVPVLKEFLSAESVDVVTRAGAGGMILSEAAATPAPTQQEASEMDAATEKKLQEGIDANAATNKRLLERAIRGDARELATKILKGTSLQEASRERVVDTVLSGSLPMKESELDQEAFTTLVNEEAKREGAYVSKLTGGGQVRGMGAAAAPTPIDTKEAEKREGDRKTLRESTIKTYIDLGMPEEVAKRAADRDLQEVA